MATGAMRLVPDFGARVALELLSCLMGRGLIKFSSSGKDRAA